MLCRYCGTELTTFEGNLSMVHCCTGHGPLQPARDQLGPVSSPLPASLPRLHVVPRDIPADAGEAFDEAKLPPLVVDGLLPASVFAEHPEREAIPILELQPVEFEPRPKRRTPISPSPEQSAPAGFDSRIEHLYSTLRSKSSDTHTALRAIGELLVEQKRYQEAEPFFQELIALDPANPAAQTGAGICLEKQGRWGEAAARFRVALDSCPNLPAALAGLGHCMLRLDNPASALAAFDRCLLIDPRQIAALIGKALSLQLMGKPQEAASLYREALQLQPGIEASLAGLMEGVPTPLPASAQTLESPDVPAEAFHEFEAAPVPSEEEELEQTIRTAFAEKDYARAALACARLKDLSPGHYQAHFNLGVAEFSMRHDEAAAALFRQATRLWSDRAATWHALGIALHRAGDCEGAIAAYSAAVALSRELPLALWNLGLLQEATGKFLQAAETFSRLAQAQPGRQEIWFHLAHALLRVGDFECAIAAARKCPDFLYSGPDLYLQLGALCWNAGDFPGSGRCFEEILKFQPGSLPALRAMAAAALRVADYTRALDLHKRLTDAGDQSLEVLCNRAGLEMRAGRPIAALAYYRQAGALQPGSQDVARGIEMARRASLAPSRLPVD